MQPPLYRLVEQGKAPPDTSAPSTQPASRRRGWDAPRYEEGDFILDDVPLEQAFTILADQARTSWSFVEIKPDWKAIEATGVSSDTRVNLRLWSPTLMKALSAILGQVSKPEAPLDFEADVSVFVTVTTRARILKDSGLIREYSIKPLMIDVVEDADEKPPPREGLGMRKTMTARERREAIVALIKDTVDPESWKQSDDCWIRTKGNVLTVRQIMDNHRSLEALMGQLYETRASDVMHLRVRPTTRPGATQP